MGRDSEERRRKRQRVDEADLEQKVHGSEKPSAEKSRSALMSSGKKSDAESPRSVSTTRNSIPDHGGKIVDTLLSLLHGNAADAGGTNAADTSGTNEALHQKQDDALHVPSGGDDPEDIGRNMLQKPAHLLHEQEGEPGDGWEVEIVKKRGLLEKFIVSPSKRKFTTSPDVAQHHPGLHGKASKAKPVETKGNQGADLFAPTQQSLQGIERESPLTASEKHSGKLSQTLNLGEAIFDAGHNTGMQPSRLLASQRCQDVFRGVISTEKFGILCSMFQSGLSTPWEKGFKTNSLIAGALDFQLLSLRMSTGIYGERPELFLADLQQVWMNIRSIGNELSVLASALSEISNSLYKDQVATLFSDRVMEGIDINGDSVPERGLSLYVPVSEQEPPDDLMTKVGIGPVKISNHLKRDAQIVMPQEVVTNALASTSVTDIVSTPLSTRKEAPKLSESRFRAKKVNVPTSSDVVNASKDISCMVCEGRDGSDFLVCSSCGGGCHAQCLVPKVVNIPETSLWSCPSCAIAADKKSDSVIKFSLESSEKHPKEPTEFEQTPQHVGIPFRNVAGEPLKVYRKDSLCKSCGKDDHEVLLCDSCESAYHMHCLSPPLNRVPEGAWYCPICMETQRETGVLNFQNDLEHQQHGKQEQEPSHHCSVCERINEVEKPSPPVVKSTDTQHRVKGITYTQHRTKGATYAQHHTKGVAYAHHHTKGVGRVCKLCGVDDKRYLLCCDACSKPFHITCLKPPLKKIPTSTWYCPSCLCQACKVDTDDDKILLCDKCDEGYHTYCLSPPLESIPQGSWFCPSCTFAKDLAVSSPCEGAVKPLASEDKDTSEGPKKDISESPKKEMSKRKRKSAEPKRST